MELILFIVNADAYSQIILGCDLRFASTDFNEESLSDLVVALTSL
jgi:hypothetical protein